MQTIFTIVLGLAFGVVFERYYFCMNSAITDVFIIRDTRRLKGLLTAVLVSAVLFNVLIGLKVIESRSWPLSWSLLITSIPGGIIFGIGMNLAGGCVSGTLFRIGQGYIASLIAFLGVAIGFGAMGIAMSFMQTSVGGGPSTPLLGATLPAALGVNPLIFALIAAVISIATFLVWKKQSEGTKTSTKIAAEKSSEPKIISPSFIVGGVLVAVLNTALFVTDGSPLGLSGLMLYLPSRSAFLINQDWASNNWMFGSFMNFSGHVMMTLMGVLFIAGAFFSALFAGRFQFRFPVRKQAISSLIGGFLMGVGVTLMLGCNVMHILGNLPQFGIAGTASVLGIVIGAWLGVKLVNRIAVR
jgi:uncharacterized membrane protein YedE/YeeE